ncbi:hypothetical protein PG999_000189 [Apiospora kogelbergensis]|uniref:Ankyrin repeat-containing protein n=1 Tax=Apiospora kogelbergensis TaxID=1337665 RepID=A0AAW0RB64_9PEZI
MAEHLLTNGAADDVGTASHHGRTPLLCALAPSSKDKSEEMAVRITARLPTGGASARVVTSEDWMPLHAVASRAHHYDPTAREQLVRLAHELIRRGAPLSAEPALLRDVTVTPDRLDGAWGFRIEGLAKSMGQGNDAATRGDGGPGNAVPDTTPLAWAIRTGAMDLVQVILDSLQSSIEDRLE